MRAIKIHSGKSALHMEFNTDCLALFALQVTESVSLRVYSDCLRKVLHEKVGRFELTKTEVHTKYVGSP